MVSNYHSSPSFLPSQLPLLLTEFPSLYGTYRRLKMNFISIQNNGLLFRYTVQQQHVVESPSLARFRGACLPLDTKCPESELNQDDSVEHTRRENSNNPHFTPGIQ
jgi:hypothetical protein